MVEVRTLPFFKHDCGCTLPFHFLDFWGNTLGILGDLVRLSPIPFSPLPRSKLRRAGLGLIAFCYQQGGPRRV